MKTKTEREIGKMKCEMRAIRNGYDGKKCLVHARCCYKPGLMVATAQYLDVKGSDLFSGLLLSTSRDDGETWSEFEFQKGLSPIEQGDITTVGCDATPMYHKKTDKILLLGHTAEYKKGQLHPTGKRCNTFYSVYDKEKNGFSKMKFIQMPDSYEICGNGSGQSVELENGELLIPVYYTRNDELNYYVCVLRCSFDGEDIKVLEIGKSLTIHIERGLYEPSLVFYNGVYYMTLRNDECGLVARSEDGINYSKLQLWKWDDESILQNYNTQQHWMIIGDELYLVYTRRGADNDHVFRHRAPLFAAKVENMHLVRDSEITVVKERGARLGNFGVAPFKDGKSIVMAAEWMQPDGCEAYGSDNSIFVSVVGK